MRRIITTTLIAALATTSLPGEAVAGPQFGNALHDNAFDQPGAQQPGARLEYDSANRLRRVKRGSLDIRYVYDGLGNLEAEIVDDGQKVTRTDLLLDESGPLPRVLGALGDDGGHELYAYGPMGVAMVRKHAGGQAPAVYHALTDELGTVRGLADGGGALAGRVAYGPFGRVRMTEGQQTRLAFAGEYRDTAGLLWLRARHYAPFLGRFLQRDTIVDDPGDPQTLNRYTYAANNPLAKVDPTGHVVWFVAIPAAMLATAMLAALITPVALQMGDLAGRDGRPASDAERAELDNQVYGWWETQQVLTAVGGAFGAGNAQVSAARGRSAALGRSFAPGGINGPRMETVGPRDMDAVMEAQLRDYLTRDPARGGGAGRKRAQISAYQPATGKQVNAPSGGDGIDGYTVSELSKAIIGEYVRGGNPVGACAEPNALAQFDRAAGPIYFSRAVRFETGKIPGAPKVWRYKAPCRTCTNAFTPKDERRNYSFERSFLGRGNSKYGLSPWDLDGQPVFPSPTPTIPRRGPPEIVPQL